MIDRTARDELAELLQHLVAGQITNDEFEDRRPRGSADPAVPAVFWNGAWMLYDDLREHRLVGKHAVPKAGRREVARWILFLKSELPYEWPRLFWLFRFPGYGLILCTLGVAGQFARWRLKRAGDLALWPFIRQSDYEVALTRSRYLGNAL